MDRVSRMQLVYTVILSFFLIPVVLADEADDIVSLQFQLQAGTEARGEFYSEKIQTINGERKIQQTITAKTHLSVSTHPEGFVAHYTMNDVNYESDHGELTEYMIPIMEAISTTNTRTVVSESGDALRTEGYETMVKSVQEFLKNMSEEIPNQYKPIINNYIKLVTESLDTSEASLVWNSHITQWIGKRYIKGLPYEYNVTNKIDLLGGNTFEISGVRKYLGRVNCNDKDTNLSCVELSSQTNLLPESAKELTRNVFEQMNIPVNDDLLMTFEITLSMVVDPKTLATHYYETLQRTVIPNLDPLKVFESIHRTTETILYE